jgi:hypothetical protein|tara:strand:+ start:52 stop:483 length:432 start_codon:yes stop_codon:yes gene_type:complete
MKKLVILCIFIINFHVHSETTWIQCDTDDEYRKKGNEKKLEADDQEYFIVITKEAENQTLEKGAYLFDKDFGNLTRVADENSIALKHIRNIYRSKDYSLNRETLYLERLDNGMLRGKCKLITEAEWMNITQNLIKEVIKGNKF